MGSEVERLCSALLTGEQLPRVERDQLLVWMDDSDMETAGALFAMLERREFRESVHPPLSIEDFVTFASRYLLRCMKEDPRGEWAHTRYEAGWELCNLFVAWWDDARVPRRFLLSTKSALEEIYKSTDSALQLAIETAVLEHLFERSAIADYFADWRSNPRLSSGYETSLEWVRKGGASPLSKDRASA